MEQQPSYTTATILHELDLGQHTLFLTSDGSIDLVANNEQTVYLADHGITLSREEAYRLLVALHEHFSRQASPQ